MPILADDICLKSNFASFRNVRLRIKPHEPSYIQGEAILRWRWLLHIVLVVVWGSMSVASVELGNVPSVENVV